MAISVVDARRRPTIYHRHDPRWTSPTRPRSTRGRVLGVRVGQVVAVQVALALLLATVGGGPISGAVTVPAAVTLVLVAWVRLRGRWLFQWLVIALDYLSRRHTLQASAEPTALLSLATPTAWVLPGSVDEGAAVISDGYGLTTLLELGDPAGLLAGPPQPLPSPAGLLSAVGPHLPSTRIQLILTAAPGPPVGAECGNLAASYRRLTDGRLLGHERAILSIRVLDTGAYAVDDLRRALASTVRKVRRRLAPVPSHALDGPAALRILAESARHDEARPIRETWLATQVGGLVQATFRLRRWPDRRARGASRLVPRLLAVPAVATSVSLSAGPRSGDDTAPVEVDLTVRLAAGDSAALAAATQALHRVLDAEGARAYRLDGEQLAGLVATLPLGVGPPTPLLAPVDAFDDLDLSLGSSGLLIGTNRHGAPVAVRLFRPDETRAVLVGGLPAAQLITLRAMAVGARVVVRTTRPRSWEPFVRATTAPTAVVTLIAPDQPVGGPPGSPARPLLVVVDVGPATTDRQPRVGWQASLVVRDELIAADVDTLARADLVLLQPLRPAEATVAGAALGLGESTRWLTRLREDMVAVVNRRELRWALLSATPLEAQFVGSPGRMP